MIIDNSTFKLWQECPFKLYEKVVVGIEKDWEKFGITAALFGTRIHQLLEEHYLELKGTPREPYPASPLDALELEAQVMFAAYLNHFPVEPFTVLDVEKTFRIQLPDSPHEYVGKFDVILRDNETGLLSILDHKTEKRQGQNNTPKAWAARTQGTLYLWAALQIYGEPIRDLIINVLKRQSDKGQIGPEFPERQRIQRSEYQKEQAVKSIIRVADQIEYAKANWSEEDWAIAANRNNCVQGYFECEYHNLHIHEHRAEELIQIDFRPTVPYLDL